MRIAIAGISAESSTFALGTTGGDRFEVLRGEELLEQCRFAQRLPAEALEDVEWRPAMRARGRAGGPVDPVFYDAAVGEILQRLEEGAPYDGVYLDMHGAMHVAGRDDAEEDFVARVREIAGPDAIIAMSMDPHGNLSERLASLVDLAACHRHSPHIDAEITVERTMTHLIGSVRSGSRPHRAWVRVPVLLPGERSGTFVEPGHSVFGGLEPAIERYGVLDANVWVGYAWGDEPRSAASVLVTGPDAAAAAACAEELAEAFWDARERFGITATHHGAIEEAIGFVLGGARQPVFVSDAGDNVTGGGDGDTTVALAALQARTAELDDAGARVLVAGLYDPGAFRRALAAGVGGELDSVGAWLSDRHAPPAPGPWRVMEIIDGHGGEGPVAALLRKGPIDVTVQLLRAAFTSPDDAAFTSRRIPGQAFLDVSPYAAVVVKNGYLFPGQAAVAGSEFMAITPGGTDLDPDRARLHRITRPLFPLDRDFRPDLSARLLGEGR